MQVSGKRVSTIVGCLAASVAICQPAQAQVRKFNIPAGAAAETIPYFGRQAGVQVLASGRLVAGLRTNAVIGNYPVDQALRLLLAGTGLSSLPPQNGVITITLARLASQVDEPLLEQPAEEGTPAEQFTVPGSETDQEIVVTGTSLRGTTPTSPVIVVTRRDIDAAGATSVEQLMRKLPQNSQGGVNQETFNSLAGGDPTEHGAGLNLRGLGQRATLVLVNGRRMAPSGGGSYVDVSLIPLSAVERVEVLTDGASAIYGSDAVGGVVNFIVRDDFDGFETLAHAGTATNGDGDQLQLGQTIGRAWSSGHGMLSYEYRLEDEIRNGDRDFSINRNPDGFFLPRERRHSILGVFEQRLTHGLTFEATGSYSHRTTKRTTYPSGSLLAIGIDQKAEAINVSGELRYELGGDWLVRADGLYSRSDSYQIQLQPGGQPVINEREIGSRLWAGGLRADGTVFNLPGGPLKLALGAEIRHESYEDLFGSTVIAPILRENKRSVRALYGEVSVPLFSNANRLPGLERLQLSAAARYEDYSDFGSTVDPKFGILWSPVNGLNLRASYGTSFRAPLLREAIDRYNVILIPASFLYRNPAEGLGGGIFLQGNNANVGPERSRSWNFGADVSPVRGLTLSANYYSIRFSDRIAMPTSAINVVGDPAFDAIVVRNPALQDVLDLIANADLILDSGMFLTGNPSLPQDVRVIVDDRVNNTAVTRTSGFDFIWSYRFAAGDHDFTLDGNVNHVIAYEDQLTLTSPTFSVVDRPYQMLDWRGRAGLSWAHAGWNANLFVNYADAYRDLRAAIERRVGSHTTVDATLAHTFGNRSVSWLRGSRVALFVENLFDKDPPFLANDPGFASGAGYDPVNASGRGRFVALQLRKAW